MWMKATANSLGNADPIMLPVHPDITKRQSKPPCLRRKTLLYLLEGTDGPSWKRLLKYEKEANRSYFFLNGQVGNAASLSISSAVCTGEELNEWGRGQIASLKQLQYDPPVLGGSLLKGL